MTNHVWHATVGRICELDDTTAQTGDPCVGELELQLDEALEAHDSDQIRFVLDVFEYLGVIRDFAADSTIRN